MNETETAAKQSDFFNMSYNNTNKLGRYIRKEKMYIKMLRQQTKSEKI